MTRGCGCRAATARPTAGGDRYLELIADQRAISPGDTARLVVRGEPITGPVLVTKEGQHVSWYRVLRPARRRRDRGADRGRRHRRRLRQHHLPARRTAVSRRAAPGRAGDRAHAQRRRDRRPGGGRSRRIRARSRVRVDRSHRRAGAGAAEPGRHRRGACTASGPTTRPIRCGSSIAASTPASTPRSRATTTSPATPGRERLQLAAPAPPAVHAGRLQGRQAGAARRCARTSPTPSTGSAIWSPTPRSRRRVAVKYPDALTTWRLTARADHRRHARRHRRRAHDHDQGPDRPRGHAAVPHRRRRGRACRPSSTTTGPKRATASVA